MGAGKRAGSRRAPKKKRSPSFQPRLLALAVGVTLAVVAWGYLVYAAIDFGTKARGGDQRAWAFLGLASVGAVACLFVGLMLVSRLLRRLGITSGPEASRPSRPAARPPRPRTPQQGPTADSPAPDAARDAAPDDLDKTQPLPRVRPIGGRRAR